MTPGGDDLRRAFERVPRAAPPAVPVERLIARLHAARRRSFALAGAAATVGGLLLALVLRPAEPEPPVHLPLRVVELPAPHLEEEPVAPGEPPEVSLP